MPHSSSFQRCTVPVHILALTNLSSLHNFYKATVCTQGIQRVSYDSLCPGVDRLQEVGGKVFLDVDEGAI